MLVTGARKGNPVGRFWDQLAYSRVLTWGRQFKVLQNYIAKNTVEAFGGYFARTQVISLEQLVRIRGPAPNAAHTKTPFTRSTETGESL